MTMPPDVKPVPRASWEPLKQEGCTGVEHVVLMAAPIALALLKFEKQATIHEHSAEFPVDVICMEGEGITSINGDKAPIRAGETVRWPANELHRLWTEDSEMVALMVEHYGNTQE